jgi:hypothetical protein
MYCTADSCAETCATKTSHTDNPRNRCVREPMLPIRIHDLHAFNLRPFNFAKALPLTASLLSLAECPRSLRCSDLPVGGGFSNNGIRNRSGGPSAIRFRPAPLAKKQTLKPWQKSSARSESIRIDLNRSESISGENCSIHRQLNALPQNCYSCPQLLKLAFGDRSR